MLCFSLSYLLCIRASKTSMLVQEIGVEEHRSALASTIQRRHPSLQADYVIGKEVCDMRDLLKLPCVPL